MKSLVTGGAGFIGSNLVDALLDLGHHVIVIDNEYSQSHEKFYWNENAENYKYDICDYDKTKNLYKGIDYVFHLAAETRIQYAISNPLETFNINSLGTTTVLQCSYEGKVKRLMYSSTSSIYGRNNAPNVETQTDDSLNPYALSKANGEKICKLYTDTFNLPTICFRYFNVYGERQPVKGHYAPVIGTFFKQMYENKPLTIVGDGNQCRDFIHVKDVVNANIKAALIDCDTKDFGQIYNIGTGKPYSINQIAKMLNHPTINVESRIGEIKTSIANNQKFSEIFAWYPQIKLEDWIKSNMCIFQKSHI